MSVKKKVDAIRHNLNTVFPGMQVQDVFEFRVTRSVGLEEEDDDIDDLFEAVEAAMRHRRFAEAVRLETRPGAPSAPSWWRSVRSAPSFWRLAGGLL